MTRPVPARYETVVRHRRVEVTDYAFTFAGSSWLIDLDAVPRLPIGLRRLVSFHPDDHFTTGGQNADRSDDSVPPVTLRGKLEDFLADHGLPAPMTVLMLARPRVLGYVFNPLTVYYCFDSAGRYVHAVAEVHNTYHQRYAYLLRPDAGGNAWIDKQFYVSPFFPVDGRYEMQLPEPGAELSVSVTLHREGAPAFVAVLSGTRRGKAPRLWAELTTPLSTRAVMLGIRRHGIALFLRGLRPLARTNKQNGMQMTNAVVPADFPGEHPALDSVVRLHPVPDLVGPDPVGPNPVGPNPVGPDPVGPAAFDELLWPDVVLVPHSPVKGLIARRLVKRAFGSLAIRVHTSDGDSFGQGDENSPTLFIARPASFYRRVGAGGLIGFGESFMAGDWASDELADVLTVMAGRMSTLIPPKLQRLRSAAVHARPSAQDNTVDGARDNIRRHYDLSNDLFELFLDPSMTYSSALFDGDPHRSHEDLITAQHRKIDRLLDTAGVTDQSRVLEIGTGWGELAIRAAQRGARVTTVTISTEQAELASKRVVEAGLAERVEVRLQDYREITGVFDAVVSVEMIEAVGANHWSEYFGAIERLLAPGGRAGLQAITMPHDRMLASMDTYTWIVKYIFPGGLIPSVRSVRESAEAAGLSTTSELNFGLHYAETLRRWRETFRDRADEVTALGFDAVFHRMWSLYLAYSEAGFRSKYLDVVQFGLSKPLSPVSPR